ncbi:hypothetical protein Tco_0800366 [Tanacetum coccineum]|uniref:Uncharacterized protein n=1 Tax=Tanacetum coccineum TaxID=301880 RepID=A0ABQ4ZXD0_9ASTR
MIVETPKENALVDSRWNLREVLPVQILSQVSDKFKTGLGYNAATAASPAVESFVNSSEMLENQEYNRSKDIIAVPPPIFGVHTFKPDLTFKMK